MCLFFAVMGAAHSALAAPTVTSSTTDLAGNATTLTITGTDFDPVAANNTVTFNNGAVGTVTAATATELSVAITTLPTATGSLTATVTTNSVSSGSAVQVANVTSAYVVGTASLLHGPAAGSGSVVLGAFPASSSWSAVANDSWLHLDGANSSGSGSKNIVFTLDANTGATRTGTLTIAGQTVTVTQAGSTYQAASPLTALVSSGLSGATRVAVDATGANVYFTDGGNSAVKRWSRLSGTTTTVFGAGEGLGNPQALALDASGNIYVGDHADDTVKKWNGTSLATVASVTDPNCLAVDTRGDVYIADASSVKKLTTATGVVTTLVSGISCQGVGVDRALNVYFTTNFPTSLRKRNASDGSVVTLIPSGLLNPQGPVVDGSGNVFMPDPSASTLHRYTAATGTVSTQTSLSLLGAAVDGACNVYLADGGTGIYAVPYAFVDPTSITVGAAAGSGSLPAVLPTSTNLTGPFAPTSTQPFLTLGTITSGVVNFDYTSNGGGARSASLAVLGKSTTINQTGVVAITSPTSASITATSASLGGNVTSDGGSAITERGVVFSVTATDNDPFIGDANVTKVTATGTTGVFTAPVTLTPATAYSFKAYATNANGTYYTTIGTFSTPSNIATLSSLAISSGILTPTFATGTTSYTAHVPNGTSTLTVTPTVTQANATVTVNGNPVTSGSPSSAITLNVGSNTLTTLVTAQDGTTTSTYTVTVARDPAADYAVTTAGNAITVTDITGTGESLDVSQPSADNISFAATGRTFSVDGGLNLSGSSGSIPCGTVSLITVNAGAGADTVNVGAFTGFMRSLTINGGTGDDTVNFNGDIAFTGGANLNVDLQNDDATPGIDRVVVAAGANIVTNTTGTLTVRVSRDVVVSSGGSLEVTNGALTVEANLQTPTPTSGAFIGVDVNGGLLRSNGSGSVSVGGKGGNSGNSQIGVRVQGGGDIIGGGSGTLTVTGTGGASTGTGNAGVNVNGSGSTITAAGAHVQVTGSAGGGTLASGIDLYTSPQITSTGAGDLTITGNGGINPGSGAFNHGIIMSNTTFSSAAGNVSVTGNGGSGANGSGDFTGIQMDDSTITSSGAGSVTVNATAGAAATSQTTIGLDVRFTSQITSSGGNVSVTGTGGNTNNASTGAGAGVRLIGNGTITAGGSGTVTVAGSGGAGGSSGHEGIVINGSGLSSNLARIGASNGATTLTAVAGNTSSHALLVGSNNAGRITTGTNNPITINADSINFAGGAIVSSGTATTTLNTRTAGTLINLGGADVLSGSPLTLGLTDAELNRVTAGTIVVGSASSGLATITTVLSPTSYSTLDIATSLTIAAAGGFTSDVTSATVFEKLRANGAVTITSGAALTVGVGGFTPAVGTVFTLLDNVSASTTTGTFTGKPEGTTITFNGINTLLSYVGGTGNDVVLTTQSTFETSPGSPATYSGVISGGNDVTNYGGGTLTLTGANTYTGKTNIQSGTISVGTVAPGSAPQPLGAGNRIDLGVAATSSGTLLYTGGAGTLDKNIFALGNGADTIQNSGSGLLTLSGTLNKTGTTLTLKGGAPGIRVTGTITGNTGSPNSDLIIDGGTTTLASANTYNGPTYIINGGILNADAVDALPTTPARSDILMDQTGSGTSTLALGVSQSILSLTGASTSLINLNANTLTVGAASGTTTFAGVISGAGGLTKDDASTLILTGANAYTGITTISGGTLQIGNGGTTGSLATSSAITNNAALVFNRSDLVTQGTDFASVIGGTGTIQKSAGGTLILNGNNTYSGATTVSAGVLSIRHANALGSTAAGTTVNSGAALQIQGVITTANEALTLNGTGVASDGALRNMTGNNAYAGLVTLGSATRINSDAFTLTLSNAGTITGAGFGLTVGGAGHTTINSIIGTGSGTLTKDGAGTLTLNGANTYTGLTTVSAGIVNIRTATALGTTANGTSVTSGATLQLQGGITVGAEALTLNGGNAAGQTGALVNVSGTNTYGGAITIASSSSVSAASGSVLNLTGGLVKDGTTLTFNGGGTINVSSVGISGASANSDLVVDGTTVNLDVASSYNGPTFIRNSGTLNANVAGALPTATRSAVTFDGTGTSVLTLGANQVAASLASAGAATITLNANTITLGDSSSNTTFAGSIGGTGGLTKDGASTQVLSGSNGYSGTTTVSAGVLSITGNINSSATLTISGGQLTTSGADKLANSAAVGISGGTLTIGGNDTVGTLTMSSGTIGGSSTLTATTYGLSGGTVDGNLGTGTLNSSGTVALNGTAGATAVNVTAGTLTLGSSDRLANGATVTVSGGALALGANNDTVSIFNMSSGSLTGTGTLTATTYGLSGGTVDGNLGTGTLNSSGTVALNGTAGATAVNVTSGTLTLGSADRLADGATVTVSGGALALGANTDTVSIFNMSSGSLTGTGTLTATTYGLSGGTVGANLGTGTLNSSGTVALNGTAAATAVNVTAGTLTLGSADRLADGATVTVSGGALALGANTDTVSIFNMSSGSITGTGTLTATTYGLSGGTVTANLGTGTLNSSGSVALNGTAAATAVNITAGTLTLGSSDRLANGATVTVSGGALALGTNTDTVSIFNMSSGSITGSGTLTATTYGLSGGTVTANLGTGTLNSSGTVALNGTAGATAVNVTAGTLTLGSANRLADGATVTVSGGALALGINSDTVSIFNMSSGSLTGSGTLTATTYGLSGGTVDANLGTGTLNSSGTVALNGTAAVSTVNVTAGTLTLGASSAVNSATTVDISGGSMVLGASSQIGNSATVTVSGGTLALGTNNDSVSIFNMSSGSLTGTGTLTAITYGLSGGTVDANLGTGIINSTGTVALNGTAGASAVNVSAGTLTLGSSDRLANGATVTVSGGTLAMGSNNDTVSVYNMSSGSITGTGTLTATTYGLSGGTVDANLGTGTLNNSGTVALNGTSGATSVNITAGTLTLGSSDRLANGATVTVSGGALALGANTDTVTTFNMSSGSLTGTGTLTATTYGLSGGTVDGNLGTGTINSSGAVALNGTAGATSVNITAGTLTLGASERLANGASVLIAGGSLAIGTFNETIGSLVLATGSISGSTGVLTASSTYDVRSGTISAILGGSVGLTKTLAGTVTLSNANTYTGTTTVSAGTLALSGSGSLSDSSSLVVNGGTYDIGTVSDTVAGVQLLSGSITGTTGVLTSTSTFDVQSGSVSAILGGTVGLTKTGAGTVTLSNANTYTGATTVSAGTLALSGSGRLSDSSSVVVNGGTFSIGSVSDTVAGVQLTSGSITGSGGVLTSSSTYDVQSGSVSAILGGSVGLTKTTAGAVTLSGTNSYTGATTLTAGSLTVNGSIATSSLTTINGGTLFGTGTVGAVLLNSAGTINAGGVASAGTLNTGNISIVDGQLHFNIGGTGSYDSLNTTGSVNLTAGGAGAKLVLDAISGYTATLNNAFTLVSNDLADAISGAFAKGTFGGTKVVTLSGVDYVENVLGSNYYGRINYSGSSAAPGTLATTGNDIILKIVTPEITITESGNNQLDGGTYDFGEVDKVVPSVPLTKTFTIRNDGEVDLMGITVNAPTGAAASDYTLNLTGTLSTLIPGQTTTFTITFDPSRIGTRNAAITIDNNDLDENPFNLALTGVGSIARDISEPWTVRYGGVQAPATRRDSVAMAVVVQKSTTRDEAVAVFATGYTTNAALNRDIYTAKYDPVTGALLWERIYAGSAAMYDEGAAIAVDSNGDVVITGYTTVATNNSNVYTAKYSGTDGSILWERTYAGSGGTFDEGNSVAISSTGNVYVAGYGRTTATGADLLAAGYTSAGGILFERLIDGGSNADDVARSVAVNSAGDIAIAGFVSVTARDFRVMKLSGTTGATQWQWHVNGNTSTNDEAFSVTFDSSGQVAATGTVSSANFDLYTVKLSAAGALIWQRQWNSSFNSSDVGYDVVADSSGNVIVGGASYRGAGVMDGYVAKYSAAAGSLLWERRFNGSVSNQDVINSVDLDGLDNVVAAGFSYNATPNSDVLTAKMFASSGNLIWERRFNGSASGWDNGVAVGVSTDGNIYVAGYAGATGGTADFLVKNYQAILPAVQTPQTISFANPGGPRVAGSDLPLSASASSGLPITFSVVSGPATITDAGNYVHFTGTGTVTIRASQQGNSTWARATPVDQSFSVIRSSQTITFVPPASLSASTNWPLTGQSTSGLALSYAVQSGPGSITAGILSFSGTGTVVVRASQAGDARFNAAANVDASITVTAASTVLILDNIAENWRDRYAGSGAGVGNDIALHIDPLGDPYTAVSGIVGGYTTNAATGKDQYLAKHLANGTKEWTYVSNASGADEIMSVEVEPVSGHIFVAGYVTTGTGQDVYLAKHDGATGARMWFYTYNGGANGNDVGVSVALQGTTHVVVGGYAVGVGAGNDFFAAKLTQDNTVVWTSVQARAGTSSDVPVKVVVGTDGSVVLAGASGSDAWTVKLASAAGNRLWNQFYNYANKPDAIRGLALDAANNVVIAAYSQGANYDMYTAKYTALDGTIIWEQRYNSSFNSSDAPWDMALDQDANVYVTGTSYRSASVRDGMTLKYSGLNGTLLWEGRFNGASAGNDENYTIAVDGIGNPVISGYTSNADTTTDVYLAKHDKGPGTVRWQRTFDGANNKNDGVKKVRVDPNGNVWMAGSVTSVGGQTEVLVLRHMPSP